MGKGLSMTLSRIKRLFPRAVECQVAIGIIFLAVVTLTMVGAAAAMAQTGGGATLVGTVKDATGAVVAGAKVTVVNTATAFITETSTTAEGGYYVPYLTPGSYRVTVAAPGFKEYVREGLTLRSAEVPRVDIALEVGALTESVTVSSAAPLLNTENVVSSYDLPADVLVNTPGVMKRTVYLMQYMPGVIGILGQSGFHIAGQAQNAIGATMDGISAKSPYTGVVNQVDGVIQGSTDAMEEVKVLTTGVSAEYGHTSGGSMRMVYKSGTNALHASFEDRYLPGQWVHRHYLQQDPITSQQKWYYQTFDLVASGPVVIPGIYNGRNKTFWLADYAINHEHTIFERLSTVPTAAMLDGDFSFPDAAGGGLPIYNPFTTRLVGSTWTRDPLANNLVPKSMFDPVASKFLALGFWKKPNLAGTPSRTGPTSNLQAIESCRCLRRDRWDAKVDHQFSPSHKIFVRYSQGHHRGQNGDAFANPELSASREISPVDDINGVLNDTYIFSPVMFNEFRIGYMRQASSNPPRPAGNWAKTLGIPGVGPETFPYFNIGYSVGAMGYNRTVGEDRVLQENLTRITGRHSLKIGYEMIRTLYNRTSTSLPSGQYNFSGGTALPFTPNTGIDFAAFEMGVVTSATFTTQLATFLPRQWSHDLYIQDDWKATPTLALNLGMRWSYSSPFKTKYGQQSQFDPTAVDPVTGLMGAITHPSGAIGKRDLNNFQPRVGLAWNFHRKLVFRASFGVMTADEAGTGGFDEYAGDYNILQPTGDPHYVFQLQNGPGPITYKINPDGTVPYTGASYSSRTATWRDPNLRRPYVMNWSGGFQYQMASTWLMTVMYQGTGGVAQTRSWNINEIPLSIALGGDLTLQNTVYQSQQNYKMYPQFGNVSLLSNFNHNTWHSANITVDKRYGRGLTLNASFNFSKSLANADQLAYYTREGKARTSYDHTIGFGAFVTYELPVGKGGRWLNRGGIVNAILGGWTVNMSENLVSGRPISVGYSGSPYKYLTTARVNALVPIEQAKVADWAMGNRFPTSAQNPYFNMSAFAYPAAYTTGSLGGGVLEAPTILWNQAFATKSWKVFDERLKLSLRLDGHNLPWKRPNLAQPNTTYNLTSPAAWGRFTGVVGDFSNFGSAQSNVQMSIRGEF